MDASLVGRTGKLFRMAVEEGKIREFARATKSQNPAYEAGEQSLSPATFLTTSVFWQRPENSPFPPGSLNWARILHGGQEFVFPGEPPRAGAVLTGQARIDRIYEKPGKRGGTMMFAEMVVEFRDEAGTLVAESRSTIIETAAPPRPA